MKKAELVPRSPEGPYDLFEYEPLTDATKQIRLMRMLHDTRTPTELCCELRHFDLVNSPAYRALSYTWGEPTPAHEININAKSLHIRDNLHAFLQHMRRMGTASWFWIDQICIDQAGSEKNEQVAMMGDIFKQAGEVVVWLDSKPPPSDGWMYLEMAKARAEGVEEHLLRYDGYDEDMEQAEMTLTDAMRKLQYWSRVWIVQELLFARAWRFLWGGVRYERQQLVELVGKALKRDSGSDHMFMSKVAHLLDRWDVTHGSRPPFKTLREAFGSDGKLSIGDSSEPLDHVYGLYSLFPPEIQAQLEVDYSVDAETLLHDILSLLVEERESLENAHAGDGVDMLQLCVSLARGLCPDKRAEPLVKDTLESIVGRDPFKELQVGFDYATWASMVADH